MLHQQEYTDQHADLHATLILQTDQIFLDTKAHLSGMDTLSGEATLSKLFCLPSGKGSSLKGKNLLPGGANSFLLEYTPFRRGLMFWNANRKSKKLPSL